MKQKFKCYKKIKCQKCANIDTEGTYMERLSCCDIARRGGSRRRSHARACAAAGPTARTPAAAGGSSSSPQALWRKLQKENAKVR